MILEIKTSAAMLTVHDSKEFPGVYSFEHVIN